MNSIDKRTAYLISCYLDDSITDQQESELLIILKEKPEVEKWFREMLKLDTLIYQSRHEEHCKESFLATLKIRESFSESQRIRFQKALEIDAEDNSKEEAEKTPVTIKLPWYARVRYAALLMVGVLIATYFINEYQYSQTEDLIRLRLKEFYGKVEVERGREVIPAQKEMELHNNDRIRTGGDASAVMEYTDEKTRVEISQHTDVNIREDKGQKLFDLDNGHVDLSVDKQPQGAGLRVTTPHAHVDVVGTIFSVDVSEAYEAKTKPGEKGKPSDSEISNLKSEIPRTRVETYEGSVRVKRNSGNDSLILAAGQQLTITASDTQALEAVRIPGWNGSHRGLNRKGLERSGRWLKYDGKYVWLNGVDWQSVTTQNPGATPGWDGNYTRVLNELQNAGINKIRVWANCWWLDTEDIYQPFKRLPSGKYDLDQWEPDYWTRLKDFVQEAKRRGIIIEYCLFSQYDIESRFKEPANYWYEGSNVNGAFAANVNGHGIPAFYANASGAKTTSGRDLNYYQHALIDKAAAEIGLLGNVYFQIHHFAPKNSPEIFPWANRLASYIHREKGLLVSCESIERPRTGGVNPVVAGMDHLWDNPDIDILNNKTYTGRPDEVSAFWHAAQSKSKVLSVPESSYWADHFEAVMREAWASALSGVYYSFFQRDKYLAKVGNADWLTRFQPMARALSTTMNSVKFQEMSPVDANGAEYDNLVTAGPAGSNHQVFCKPGSEYIVYFWGTKSSTNVSMNLPRGSYVCRWIDPRSGKLLDSLTVTGSGSTTIQSPDIAGWDGECGLVLVIRNQCPEPGHKE